MGCVVSSSLCGRLRSVASRKRNSKRLSNTNRKFPPRSMAALCKVMHQGRVFQRNARCSDGASAARKNDFLSCSVNYFIRVAVALSGPA